MNSVGQLPQALAAPARAAAFADLNPAQQQAVDHGLDRADARPLLVIAGAGSGKTLTLASRVAKLVLAGGDPQRILLLTFSRRAAADMQRRVGLVLHQALGLGAGVAPPRLPWAGTFHSIGARLVREQAELLGLNPAFTILDRGDAEDLMGWVRHSLKLADTTQRFPLKGTCLAIYSRVVNSREPLAQVLQAQFPWCAEHHEALKQLFRAYADEKRHQAVLDYDDLLLVWAQMAAEPALAAMVAARFDQVLVDEYQDTNRLQAEILMALRPGGQGLTVVGDDAQSIYSFRAAEVRNILDFPSGFSPPARVLTLERNYRSTQPILDASNAVIALAGERFAKTLWTDRASDRQPELVTVDDEAAQARWVCDRILLQRENGLRLKSQAVLFRTASHSAPLELELARRNIPFVKFGGLKFLEAAHVKDLLSVLRWAENPRHRLAGFRVVQLLPGVGAATARRLMDSLDTPEGAADPAAALAGFQSPPAARSDWLALRQLLLQLGFGGVAALPWPDQPQAVLAWYQPQLERLFDDARVRLGDLGQLQQMARAHRHRESFLTELSLDPPQSTSDEAGVPLRDEDYLILSTIHSAKGQEWQSVFVLNVVDGCMPADLSAGEVKALEEERRLLYVAMTRAKNHLQLMVPQRFYVTQQRALGDTHMYGGPSRFIPPAVQRLFRRIGPGVPADAPPLDVAAARRQVMDVAARLRAAWD